LVGGVDGVVRIVGLNKLDVLLDAAGADLRLVPFLRAAEPRRAA